MPEYKPKKFKLFLSLIVVFTALSFFVWQVSPSFAVTGINRQMNFQGKLVNPDGTNVTNGDYTVIFSLYNHPTAGSPDSGYLWQETQTVTVTDGIFRAALGSQTAFPDNFNFNWSGLFLGMKVNSDDEMEPRIQMAAVPFAFNSQQVAGLTVQDENGIASTSGILKVANGKTITFGNTFNSGTNSLTFTTTNTTGLTLPTTGTLLTNAAAAAQGITSTQTTGTMLALLDLTGLTGAITGLSIGLTSTTDSQNKTGLSFDLTGGSSGVYYDLYGTGGTWSVTRDGALHVASCDNCGGGVNYWALAEGMVYLGNTTTDLAIGGNSTTSAAFAVLNVNDNQPIASISGKFIVMPNNGWGGVMGIGTTDPLAPLQVNGLSGGTDTNGIFRIQTNSGTNDVGFKMGGIVGAGTAGYTYIQGTHPGVANDGNLALNPSGGNVGIGTTAPGANLEVLGSTTSVASVSAITSGYGLKFVADDTNGAIIQSLRNGTLIIGGDKTGNIVLSPRDGNGYVRIGTSTDGLKFDIASGPTYSGTARPTKIITLSPEYAGAALTASGSAAITGTMTSDNTLNAGSIGWKNYYQWSSTEASAQDYTIAVRVTLPQDFDAWQTGTCPGSTCAMEIAYQTGVAGTTNNNVAVWVNNAESTPATNICAMFGSYTSWTSFGCTSTNLATSPGITTAGATASILIRLQANNTGSALARVGDITLRYYAKF